MSRIYPEKFSYCNQSIEFPVKITCFTKYRVIVSYINDELVEYKLIKINKITKRRKVVFTRKYYIKGEQIYVDKFTFNEFMRDYENIKTKNSKFRVIHQSIHSINNSRYCVKGKLYLIPVVITCLIFMVVVIV